LKEIIIQELINAGVLEGDEFELDVAALPDYTGSNWFN
jgi:hypothetical protein